MTSIICDHSSKQPHNDWMMILTHKKPKIRAWRFDFLWDLQAQNVVLASVPNVFIQTRMKQCIDEFVVAMDHEEIEENNISRT